MIYFNLQDLIVLMLSFGNAGNIFVRKSTIVIFFVIRLKKVIFSIKLENNYEN